VNRGKVFGEVALRVFVGYLTLAALVLHMLLGCCWHHAHSWKECAAAEHHDHVGGEPHQPTTPSHHQSRCQQGKCVFVRPSHEQFDLAHCDRWPALALPASLAPVVEHSAPRPLLDLSGPLWPLRRHLMQQVLLI